jgi:hypothetical protein
VLSRSAFFRRILACPPARELLLNSLAVGEADSALDLDRVAEHVTDPLLSRRIYRHFAEEQKHARLFRQHLEARGFEATPLPAELDYERYAQRYRMGTPKARLDDPRPFDAADLILFFAGSKAGEERACAELEGLMGDLAGDPETVALLRTIHADEVQRLAAAGHARRVRSELRAARRAEARAHRAVSRAFMGRLMALLEVPRAIRAFAGLAIDAAFALRWLFPGGLDAPRVADPMPVPVRSEDAA